MYLKTAFTSTTFLNPYKNPQLEIRGQNLSRGMKLDSIANISLPLPSPFEFLSVGNFRFLRVGVGSLLPAESGDDVDEATVVLNATSRPSRLLLLLLLLLHLGSLTLDFAGASQGAVDFASKESSVHLQRAQLGEPARDERFGLDENSAVERENLIFRILDSFERANVRLEPFHRLEPGHLHRVERLTADEKLHLGPTFGILLDRLENGNCLFLV